MSIAQCLNEEQISQCVCVCVYVCVCVCVCVCSHFVYALTVAKRVPGTY